MPPNRAKAVDTIFTKTYIFHLAANVNFDNSIHIQRLINKNEMTFESTPGVGIPIQRRVVSREFVKVSHLMFRIKL